MDNTYEIVGTAYQTIKEKCDRAGIPVSELCRRAGVDRSLLERWRISDPSSIETFKKLNDVLEGRPVQPKA